MWLLLLLVSIHTTVRADYKQIHTTFDCTGKADGYYEKEKCKPYFFSCDGGRKELLECTPGLVYDSRIRSCDYPEACKNPRRYKEKPTYAAEYEAMPYYSNKYDCTYKKDGLYSIAPCSESYVQCFKGVTYVMKCPSNLLFNGNIGFCDYPEACKGSASSATPHRSSYFSEGPQQFYASSFLERLRPHHWQDKSFFCKGKSDGYYSLGCSSVYISCMSGEYNEFTCPANLKYSSILKHCDYELAVPECNKKYFLHKSVDTSKLCELKGDGAHQLGCHNKYVVCNNGYASTLYCPTNLVFNEATSACVYPFELANCIFNRISF